MADENYIDLYVNKENNKEGIMIAGRDVVRLDAPEVLLSPDTPLLTNAQDVAGAINELFKEGGGGGDEEDWQPPDDWISVPEPEPYEIYLLAEITDLSSSYANITIGVSRPSDANAGNGALSVDWGDGTVQTWTGEETGLDRWGTLKHTYQKTGQYLIKIITTDQSCFFQSVSPVQHNAPFLIIKSGSEIIYNIDDIYSYGSYSIVFGMQYRLKYVKIKNRYGLPRNQCFTNCYSLCRVDMDVPSKVIPGNAFYYCVNLKKFDFSKVTEIKSQGLAYSGFKKLDFPECISIESYGVDYCYSLKEINAPMCRSVGSSGFYADYGLEKAVFAEDCTFGSNCFQNCWSLYPRPDGSIN